MLDALWMPTKTYLAAAYQTPVQEKRTIRIGNIRFITAR